ncbi:MAG: glycosyltransferase [bacterium]|nr:glycosyltransferase [bacterium]
MSGLAHSKVSDLYVDVLESVAGIGTEISIAGTGPGRDWLAAELSARNIPGVVWLGNLDFGGVVRLYRSSDLCLYLTGEHTENHSLALIEAFACGVPVICENRGGLPEQVEQWRTGVVCNSFDEIVEAVHLLRADSDLLRSMSRQCRRHALRYDIRYTVDDFLRFLSTSTPVGTGKGFLRHPQRAHA